MILKNHKNNREVTASMLPASLVFKVIKKPNPLVLWSLFSIAYNYR